MWTQLHNQRQRYSFYYSMRRIYWIPIMLGLLAALLFFPPLHQMVPIESQPAWFWVRILILMMAVYIAIVITYY